MTQTIVVTEFLSLDGVMEAPNEWNIPYVDETLGADIQGELDRATALLYGRTTYDAMASAWPKRTGATANRFNDLPKYVVSSTLRETSWAPTTILRGDAVAVMKELKSSGDGRILVWGSRQLVQTMAAARLVDEYVLYVHPLVLGKGAHLFAEGHHQDLELTSAKTYARGVVALRLRPRAK
ncbi:MAG: dihydrofolate reductase [Deltaproteobacteria bacterium]|jgi:dihydrofolate reductase|nr:MAG: dihydrofolate reductase [Deltaproteobacteria bacterium]